MLLICTFTEKLLLFLINKSFYLSLCLKASLLRKLVGKKCLADSFPCVVFQINESSVSMTITYGEEYHEVIIQM